MIRLSDSLARPTCGLARALALALALAAAPLAAQQTFSLPPASPSPTPAPAGPADERAGVAIPPRAVPSAQPSTAPTPVIQPLPSPSASRQPSIAIPTPRPAPAPAASDTLAPPVTAPGPAVSAAPSPAPAPTNAAGPGFSLDPTAPPVVASRPEGAPITASWPAWWPYAAGGIGALVLLAGGALAWRRRRAKPLRLAAPVAGPSAAEGNPDAAAPPPRLDLVFEVTAASRSLMMFTLEYRLTIANRSDRAVSDLHAAVQLACARASATPSPGAAQSLAAIDRIGPQQARSVTGTVQLPLSAVQPLRQGQTPLFIPLVHVTLEGESLPAWLRTYVIGTPSPSGRVHPIALDMPPGGIAGLVAQAVAVPAAAAAA